MSNIVSFPLSRASQSVPIEALRARDPGAIADLYRAQGNKVRAFATRMLGDPSLAEDVVHDVFVALPDALLGFRGDSQLSTFLIGITVNVCRRRLRSRVRGHRAVKKMLAREVEDEVLTPEAEARGRQLADALERGLESLSVDHREVIVLCAIQQRTSRDVAQILGIPEGTVRTRLMAARRRLGTFMREAGVR